MVKLCILVPARNCAPFLEELVRRTPLRGPDDEIIIVDDASSDGTFEVASRLPRVHAARNDVQRGYGGTSKRLYEIALERGGDLAINIHGDLGHRPEAITPLADVLYRGELDIVFGSRLLYMLNQVRDTGVGGLFAAKDGMPPSRIFGHMVITTIQNFCYGTHLHSFHEGMRGCTRAVMEWTLQAQLTDWYDFDTHLTVNAHRAGFRMGEVPLAPHYRPEAQSGVPLIRYGYRAITTAIRNNRFVRSSHDKRPATAKS